MCYNIICAGFNWASEVSDCSRRVRFLPQSLNLLGNKDATKISHSVDPSSSMMAMLHVIMVVALAFKGSLTVAPPQEKKPNGEKKTNSFSSFHNPIYCCKPIYLAFLFMMVFVST